MKVIGIGDNVCDQYADQKMMYPGGQAMNFSVYARMLGMPSAYLGVFGRDAVAAHVIRTLDSFQIDHSHCRQYDGENGYARINLNHGDRQFLFSNHGGIVNEHPLDLNEEDLRYLSAFRLIHTSNNSHFNSQLPKLRSLSAEVSYDYSGRMWRDPAFVAETAPYIDYAFLSVGKDFYEEAGRVRQNLLDAGVQMVIFTLGSAGEEICWHDNLYRHQPPLVKAVDTLGAGDSFAAAFLLYLLQNGIRDETIGQAMLEGEALAARTCMVYGAYGHGIPFDPREEEKKQL